MCGLLMGYSFLITVNSKPFSVTYFIYLGLPSPQNHTHGHHSPSDQCVCLRQTCFCCDDKYPGWVGLAVVVMEKYACQLMNGLDLLVLFRLFLFYHLYLFLPSFAAPVTYFSCLFFNSTHSYYYIPGIVTLEALRIYCCVSRGKFQHGEHISVRPFQIIQSLNT